MARGVIARPLDVTLRLPPGVLRGLSRVGAGGRILAGGRLGARRRSLGRAPRAARVTYVVSHASRFVGQPLRLGVELLGPVAPRVRGVRHRAVVPRQDDPGQNVDGYGQPATDHGCGDPQQPHEGWIQIEVFGHTAGHARPHAFAAAAGEPPGTGRRRWARWIGWWWWCWRRSKFGSHAPSCWLRRYHR